MKKPTVALNPSDAPLMRIRLALVCLREGLQQPDVIESPIVERGKMLLFDAEPIIKFEFEPEFEDDFKFSWER